jgi:Heterokaryon incompatibility protein (HET)
LANHNSTCNRVIFPLSARASQRDNVVNIVHGGHGLVVPPTRLIFVGSEDSNDPPRIIDGQECLFNGGYLILSYCWGMTPKDAPWQLTTMTRQQFSTEIPLSILPQTLHDAIMCTRKLGERYIWIDSMCILQDSSEDWQREASRMASIYGSATVTLVAASSSVYGGMTDRRNPLRNSAAGLDLQDGSSKSTVYLLPNGQPRNAPQPPPTDSRGWCYQEDLLSSRLVKMTQNSVLWQCVGAGSDSTTRAQNLEQLGKHPPYRWYTLWYRLIERYSNKSLTNPKDKLLAFYGIACDKAGQAYLAGFLKTDPWASLLWCRDENQIQRRPGRRYEEYVAPTWSWASIDAPVLFYEANARHWRKPQLDPSPMDPELHHAEVQPISSFDTGAVKSGSIEISAYVVMTRTASVQPFLFNTKQGAHTYGRRNCVDPLTGEALGLIVFDVALESKDNMLLCCALLQTADMSLREKNGTTGLGLALSVQEATPTHLKCTRVGYVRFTSAFSALCRKRCIELS